MKSFDRCITFFMLFRGNKTFVWDDKCETTFQDLKQFLSTPPFLVKPINGELLLLDLVKSNTTVSVTLVREVGMKQQPIYYISHTLNDAKTHYSMMEIPMLTIVTTVRKLRPYFQCHSIIITTAFPLRSILHRPKVSSRFMKWVVELGGFDITY